MKKIFLFAVLFCSILFQAISQNNNPVWIATDRQALLEGLRSTQKDLVKEVEGLNDAQLHFKPDSTQWSVAEVVEHLGTYEELLYWDLLNNQYADERPDLADKVKGLDSAMKAYATDPNKGQTPFIGEPLGRFQTKEQLLGYFNRFRNEVIKLVDTTSTNFRLHFIFRSPDAGLWHIRDLDQYTLLWIAHTERHINQIRRIKSNPNFPK